MEGYRRFKCNNSRTLCEICRRRIKVDEWVQAKPPDGQSGWRMTRCYPSCQEALARAYVSPDPKRMAELLAPKTRTFKYKLSDRYPRSVCIKCSRFFEDGEMVDAEVTMGSIWRNLQHQTRCAATRTTVAKPRNASTPISGNTSTPSRGNASTPSGGNTSTPNHGNASTPTRGNDSTPSGGNASTPNRGNASTPSRGNASTPNRGDAPTPNRGSALTPSRGNASITSGGNASTPSRGYASTPIRGNASTTNRGQDAPRAPEKQKRHLISHAPRAPFGGHARNEGEPPRHRRRHVSPPSSERGPWARLSSVPVAYSQSQDQRSSTSPASSAFSGPPGAAVAATLKPMVSKGTNAEDGDESVECLGAVGIDEQLAQRQKEQGVVDLSGAFNAAD